MRPVDVKRRRLWQEQGLCVRCSKRLAVEGRPKCERCHKRDAISNKRWRDKNPVRVRKYSSAASLKHRLRAIYDLSVEEYQEMQRQQNGLCAICLRQKLLEIDHDHISGKVRGLLCRKCNLGLGCFADDPTQFQRVLDYLDGSLIHNTYL